MIALTSEILYGVAVDGMQYFNATWGDTKWNLMQEATAGNDTKLDFPSNSTCMNSTSTQITEDHACIAFTYSRPASPLLLVAAS